jgi:ElaB/YqjD/DUF883 family membrane-anchored ribosome-binding protein
MIEQRDDPLDYAKGPAHRDGSPAAAEATMDRVEAAAARSQERAGKISEQMRECGSKAQDAARNFQPFVRKSMREQPMATLAVASLLGFVLGALWKK